MTSGAIQNGVPAKQMHPRWRPEIRHRPGDAMHCAAMAQLTYHSTPTRLPPTQLCCDAKIGKLDLALRTKQKIPSLVQQRRAVVETALECRADK